MKVSRNLAKYQPSGAPPRTLAAERTCDNYNSVLKLASQMCNQALENLQVNHLQRDRVAHAQPYSAKHLLS